MSDLKIEDRFKSLGAEITAGVTAIKDNPRMQAATKHIDFLISQRHEVQEKLDHVSDQANDIDAAAQELLDGAPVATLACESVASKKATLNSQIDAFKRAITIATERRGRLEQELVKDACADLHEVAQLIQLEMIDAFEDLQLEIQKAHDFYEFLSSQGYKEGSRPNGWQITQFERGLLVGGRGYPSIAHHVGQRREVLGLSADKVRR